MPANTTVWWSKIPSKQPEIEHDADLHESGHYVKYVVILPDPGAVWTLYIQGLS